MNCKKSSLFLITTAIFSLICAVFSFFWTLKAPSRENQDVRAIRKALPGVVNIGTERVIARDRFSMEDALPFASLFDHFLYSQRPEKSYSLGSGFVIDESGLVVTNAHVVARASKIEVTLSDRKICSALPVAEDPVNDIALLKLTDPPEGLTPIRCDDSGKLFLGERVIALGNPFGLDSSVTTGILSGIKRKFVYGGRVIFSDILQTDAMVYPGSSGGPLINIEGRLIGMNMSVYENAPGIGFAIPLSRIENVLAKWLIPERFSHLSLGIIPELKDDRIVIADVMESSPAAECGLKKGMILERCNGRKIPDLLFLGKQFLTLKNGGTLSLKADGRNFRIRIRELRFDHPIATVRQKLSLELTKLTPVLAKELELPLDAGLAVSGILPGTPTEIRRGDILLSLNSYRITSEKDLIPALNGLFYSDTADAVFLTTVQYRGKTYFARRNVRLKVR